MSSSLNLALSLQPAPIGVPGSLAPHILLVEDDGRQRSLVADVLSDRAQVQAVGTFAAGIQGLIGTVDLLITDIDLGSNFSGLDLVRLAMSLRPDLPIIVLSARDPAVSPSFPREDIAYLRKPCPQERLLRTVAQLLPEF